MGLLDKGLKVNVRLVIAIESSFCLRDRRVTIVLWMMLLLLMMLLLFMMMLLGSRLALALEPGGC